VGDAIARRDAAGEEVLREAVGTLVQFAIGRRVAVAIDERQAFSAQLGGESGCLRQSIGQWPALADQVLALLRGEFVVV